MRDLGIFFISGGISTLIGCAMAYRAQTSKHDPLELDEIFGHNGRFVSRTLQEPLSWTRLKDVNLS